jgi:hypothetical protein
MLANSDRLQAQQTERLGSLGSPMLTSGFSGIMS